MFVSHKLIFKKVNIHTEMVIALQLHLQYRCYYIQCHWKKSNYLGITHFGLQSTATIWM